MNRHKLLWAWIGITLLAVVIGCKTVERLLDDVNKLCEAPKVPVFDVDGVLTCVAPGERPPIPQSTPLPTVAPPTPTTTTSTTTTTTSTTLPELPRATPTPSPSPTPCQPEIGPPSGAVDVRQGLKASSCESPGENRRCFKGQPSGATVAWEADETACWPAWVVAEQGRMPKVLNGIALYCEQGYLSDPDDTRRGCFDAWGRRYQWDGGVWREQVLADRFSGWWLGICPPKAPRTCEATPKPIPTPGTPIPNACTLPPMRECGGRDADSQTSHRWGCCIDSEHPDFGRYPSPFDAYVEKVQDDIETQRAVAFDRDGRVDEDEYMTEAVRRLTAMGFCVKRSVNPSEEIGIKGSNAENYQYDLILSNGRPRHHGYTAYCSPSRF